MVKENKTYFLFHGETALNKINEIIKFQGETANFSEKNTIVFSSLPLTCFQIVRGGHFLCISNAS